VLILINGLTLIHVLAGFACLGLGLAAMLARPKGAERHRRPGRRFMASILIVAVTALILLTFRWNPFFFALSVFSFYLAFSGWRVLRRKRPDLHADQRARPVDWLAATASLATGIAAVFIYFAGGFGHQSDQAAVVLGTLAFAALAAVYDLWRFAFPLVLPRLAPRVIRGVWLLEHQTKLSGAFIALACAFSGTVARDIPPALAQTIPAMVGTPLLLFFAWQQWRRLRRTTSPATTSSTEQVN